MPEVGLEPTLCCHNGILNPDPAFENKALAVEGAQKGAQPPNGKIIDPELATVNTSWPLSGVAFVALANDPVYSTEHLADDLVFTSVLTVTYRTLK